MLARTRLSGLVMLIAATVVCRGAGADEFTVEELARRTIERRAVEAAIWGQPIVSVDAMRQAFFRDAGAEYGDILYLSKPADWKFQTTTPNASSLYVYFNYNLRAGPVVLDFPAAAGAGLFGTLLDAWQTPLADIGPEGEDKGKGGKYLLMPPGAKREPVAAGYIPVVSPTFNGYALFRAIPATSSPEDLAKAIELIKKMRIYPLAQADKPPKQRHIDIAGTLFDGIVRYDDTFFDSLARMVNEEPVQSRDLVAMAQLRSLGIEQGQEFKPDPATRSLLHKAAAEAQAGFMHRVTTGERWWPKSRWILSAVIGPKTGFSYLLDDRLEIDERGMLYFLGYAPPQKLGAATFYLGAFHDSQGEPLRGDKSYRLRIPPAPPVKQYWAVTIYDLASAGFIRESPRLAIDSYGQRLQRSADGSIDVYFGPFAPKGKETNYIFTAPGRPWFSFFRFYGPEKAVFDKTWTLGDFEQIK